MQPRSTGADYERVASRFRPIFAQIEAGAVEREQSRSLPHEPIKWLMKAGFGAVRVPVEYGGAGVSVPQLVQLLIELAEADSNLPQALRGHFAYVEDRLNAEPGPARDKWFARFVAGDLFGNACTEIGAVTLGTAITTVTQNGDHWLLNGTKFYSTGSIFAEWIDVYAQRSDNDAHVLVPVSTRQQGVRQSDDWDGFGQRTTGSGTAVFENARVESEDVIPLESRFKYAAAFYQLVLLAVLAGIGRAARRDIAREVRHRQRVFSHGNAQRASDDAQVQQVVGEISALAYAAEASTLRAAIPVQRAYETRFGGDDHTERQANIDAEIETGTAQVIVTELIQRACSQLFDALGASGLRADKALDRHWRNARTVCSHNPMIYKARIVGDYAINGTEPSYLWQVGKAPERS
jgi:alkylation response protein AidB-like acyl-CoA dehydrogenase